MIEKTPVMIFPEKSDVPALVAITTLCGTAASAFENEILNAVLDGALRVDGENAKSFAAIARVGGAAVGPVVGAGVGFGLGVGVGRGLGVGVGVGLGVGFGVASGAGGWVGGEATVADVVETGARLAGGLVCAAAEGVELGGASVAGGDSTTDGAGTEARSLGEAGTGEASVVELSVGAPQAAVRRPMAMSRCSRAGGTAAL